MSAWYGRTSQLAQRCCARRHVAHPPGDREVGPGTGQATKDLWTGLNFARGADGPARERPAPGRRASDHRPVPSDYFERLIAALDLPPRAIPKRTAAVRKVAEAPAVMCGRQLQAATSCPGT